MLKGFTTALKSHSAFNFAHLIGARGAKKDKTPVAEAGAEIEEVEEEVVDEGAAAAAAAATKKGKTKKKTGDDDEDEDEEASAGEDDGEDGDEDEEEEEDEEEAAETSDGEKGKKKGSKAAAPIEAKKADKGAFKRGRKAERRRVGLILSNPAAANNIGLALKLACNTGMSSVAAITLLEATPAASRAGRLDRQMQQAGVPEVPAGAPESPKGEAAVSASWDRAMKSFHPAK